MSLKPRTDSPLASLTAPSLSTFTALNPQALARERAARLAARGQAAKSQAERRDVLVCEASGNLYGFETTAVTGVILMPGVTAVPQAHNAVIGIFGRNGRIFTAIDLTAAISLVQGDRSKGHLVLLRHSRMRLAVRVDRALAFAAVIADSEAASATPIAQNVVSGYALPADENRDIGRRRIAVLDANNLIQPFLLPSRSSGV